VFHSTTACKYLQFQFTFLKVIKNMHVQIDWGIYSYFSLFVITVNLSMLLIINFVSVLLCENVYLMQKT